MRETNYRGEYVEAFVEKWDQLINWEARAAAEGDFFIDILREWSVNRVLDVATGTGFHSVRLLEAGFDVTSADGSPTMLSKARANAARRGHTLRTVEADWRWLSEVVHDEFDAVICLGNSFTHLFSELDRRRALAGFHAVLRRGGVLIVDQRNYDAILDDGKGGGSYTYYYCGIDVRAEPEHVDPELVRFKYTFPDGQEFRLNMFPLRKAYTRRLLLDCGFETIATYADFEKTRQTESPDFFVHVAAKLASTAGCS